MRILKLLVIFLLLAAGAVALLLPARERVLGSYFTSLEGRTRGQRMNAMRAARELDGVVIAPGQDFSFNRAVGSWTLDRGYVLAPVSYDGELVVDWGGGVCQTSSTLYNAALLAGLQILERHRHAWAPGYVPAGCDAAVAQRVVDLRLRNPYTTPLRLRAVLIAGGVGFEILGTLNGPVARVDNTATATVAPGAVLKYDARYAAGQRRLLTHGRPGVRATVYRTFLRGPQAGRRELVSIDSYPPMNRVTALGTR